MHLTCRGGGGGGGGTAFQVAHAYFKGVGGCTQCHVHFFKALGGGGQYS